MQIQEEAVVFGAAPLRWSSFLFFKAITGEAVDYINFSQNIICLTLCSCTYFLLWCRSIKRHWLGWGASGYHPSESKKKLFSVKPFALQFPKNSHLCVNLSAFVSNLNAKFWHVLFCCRHPWSWINWEKWMASGKPERKGFIWVIAEVKLENYFKT